MSSSRQCRTCTPSARCPHCSCEAGCAFCRVLRPCVAEALHQQQQTYSHVILQHCPCRQWPEQIPFRQTGWFQGPCSQLYLAAEGQRMESSSKRQVEADDTNKERREKTEAFPMPCSQHACSSPWKVCKALASSHCCLRVGSALLQGLQQLNRLVSHRQRRQYV